MGKALQVLVGILATILSLFFKLALAILVGVLLLQLMIWYVSRSANEFCDSLTPTDNYKTLIEKANASGYRVFEFKEREVHIVKIPTQDSPFFRMACVVTLSEGEIIGKEVLADD